MKVLMRVLTILILVSIVAVGCTSIQVASNNTTKAASAKVLLASEVQWEKLNPARGDKSPQAGTLWGDRMGTVPTGFLAKFVDGFSSPPHLHNATYRAVVISGLIHNDDPDAVPMWMSKGSFWTQPKGEVHITAAKGKTTVALVEIDKGPYLVLPPEKAFDSGERPINVDASNIMWVDPHGMSASANSPKLAYLLGNLQDGQSNGTFVKLPAGFKGEIRSYGSIFRAVVITGEPQYFGTNTQTLEPGSYFSSKGESVHQISSNAGKESIIYVRTNGRYKITASEK
ncbi:DUF4437 domain-containing protein [filamentous cyanobacterium LEGE 11480]|uniref:DUF4437 domain-containing protein n=1 Tax=Romeriopsis navalis LEGE 11480 TaxID=2777977 RepID=A0A928Z530_9CYAN|nr:DUF4437 domain-containing protein [Romeriopsis navalis]MBE9032374.1 DUF4437 domain-containing protein [Romeriopsis navalis LEGE 11480]